MISLSRRLQAAADLVLEGRTAADIGCDHGQLAGWLVQSGTVPHAIASDVGHDPLEGARALLTQEDISGVDVRLGSGLSTLRVAEASTIILAGMGGALCIRLLDEEAPIARSADRWVLQPNTQWPAVRRWVASARFILEHETLCHWGGHFYWTAAIAPRSGDATWSEADLLLGPILRRTRGPTFEAWIRHESERRDALIESLERTLGSHHPRLEELRRERLIFEKAASD